MTFSIVARSADGESWGVAVASKFLAVGSAVPAAVAGVGAIATQADANVAYKGLALAHLDDGANASVALMALLEQDDIAVDLRVDDHADPVPELARLLDLSDLYLTASTETEKVVVTAELEAE